MSLQVWLPLINDYKNYGLSDLEFSRSTKYRYIRFVIDAKRGTTDNYTQLSMFQFLDKDNNVYSYPAGTTVSTSMSGYSSSEGPDNILDGNVNTKFCCPWSAGGYLQINLGGSDSIDISKYSRFRWYTANDADWRDPTSFRVLFSTDGTNFIEGVTVTNASITTSRHALAYVGNCLSDGKIGQTCHHNYSNSEGGLLSDKKLQSVGNNVSMFAWVNFDNFAVNPIGIGGTHTIFGDGYPAATGMGFNVVTDGSKKVVAINTGTGNTRTWGDYRGITNISAGTWYHIGFTYNGSQIKIYVNGVLDATHNYSGQSNPADYVHVASWARDGLLNVPTIFPHYKSIGRINDFRIYDHVLSTKEIKLLSQGLVAHYQLKGMGKTNYLKGSGQFTKNNPLIRNASDVSHMYDSYIYHNGVLSATLTASGIYTFSVECDGNPTGHPTSGTTGSQRLFSLWLQNQSSGTHYHVVVSKGADGRYYSTFDLPAGTYNVRTNLYAADNVNYTIKFWDMKLTFGEYDPNDPWCPNEEDELYSILNLGAGNEPDVSGYGNNATKNGSFVTGSSPHRYGSCYRFTGSNYINCGRSAMVKDAITVSCWAYMDNWSAFTSQRLMSCTESGGWNFEPNGTNSNYLSFAMGTGTSSCTYKVAISDIALSSFSGWHMITGTYDGLSTKIYVDGVLRGTNNAYSSKVPIFYNASNSIFIGAEAGSSATTPDGNYFTGNIADVRIYGTALSAADIADLYKNSASLSKDGTLFAYEFNENAQNTINKNGVVATGGFNDKAIPTYDMKIKALDDGSTWARIHHLDVTQDKQWFANATEVAKCLGKHNRYSRMGDVDKYGIDSNTVFLLLGDSVSDCSLNKMPITNVGVTVSTAQSKFGGCSLYFNGSSRLNFPSWDLDGSDFTIDWWEYPTSATNGSRFSSSYTTTSGTCGGLLLGYTGTRVYASTAAEGRWNLVNGATMMSVTANTWTHWAFVKSGNTLTSFKNGVQFATTTLNGKIGWHPHIAFSIGSYRAGDVSYFTGYIDEFRISNVARWKTNFTPPSTSYREYEFMLTYPSMKKTVPAGYTELEYIQATGTQWINTGVTGHARWEFDIQFTNTTKRQLMGYWGSGDEYWGCQTDGKYGLFAGQTIGVAGGRDTIVHDYQSGAASLWVQNQTHTVDGTTNIGSNQYQLFNIMSADYACCAKLWRCKCVQGGSLIRDFVPAMRNSDGVIGLYDIVNNAFYTNAGSGSFLCNYSYLNYIESTGIQYINTGVVPTNTTEVEISFTPTGGLTENSIFGSQWSASGYFLMFYQNKIRWHSGNSVVDIGSYKAGDKVVCHCANTYIVVNGVRYNITGGTNTTNPIVLLGDMGYNASKRGIGRIEYVKMWDNGTLVRDYVPCNHSGSIGMFDKVTHAFHGNAGSGAFQYGGGKNNYQWLDYVESSGTQYINTGFAPTSNSRIVIRASSSGPYSVYGMTGNGTSFNLTGNGNGMYYYWGGQAASTISNWFNQVHTFEQNKNVSYIDGRAYHTHSATTWSTSLPIFLFARNNSGSVNDIGGTVRIYSCQLYENGALVRDYVPCVSPSGKVGLYDKVTKRFYGNSGTGNFIAGPTKESLPLYNRWIQTSSPSATAVTGFKPITTAWTNHNAGLRKHHGSSNVYDCDSGTSWYAPIGQTATWTDTLYIPAADGSSQTETELWVRTDRFADANQMKIYNGSIIAKDYIEI